MSCRLVWFHPLASLQVPCLLCFPALLCFGVRDVLKLGNFKGKGLFYTFAFLTFGSFNLFHYKWDFDIHQRSCGELFTIKCLVEIRSIIKCQCFKESVLRKSGKQLLQHQSLGRAKCAPTCIFWIDVTLLPAWKFAGSFLSSYSESGLVFMVFGIVKVISTICLCLLCKDIHALFRNFPDAPHFVNCLWTCMLGKWCVDTWEVNTYPNMSK